MFGWKAMNLPFAAWVNTRGRGAAPVWVMFHEVAFPLVRRPFRHMVMARANRLMARWIAHAASRVFVSIPMWMELLRTIAPRAPKPEWRPVPSNISSPASAAEIAAVRRRYLTLPGPFIGHFGTYGKFIAGLLVRTVPTLLMRDPGRVMLFMGKGSSEFRAELVRTHPELEGRTHSTGQLAADYLINHLHACDWLFQPYVDGVSSRRTTLMTGLAAAKPIITNLGPLSEPIWTESRCVVAAASPDADRIIETADAALRCPPHERDAVAQRARLTYEDVFSLDQTIRHLRSDSP
jgi:hypothetical protein